MISEKLRRHWIILFNFWWGREEVRNAEVAVFFTGYVLGTVKTSNASYGHHGEMAWQQTLATSRCKVKKRSEINWHRGTHYYCNWYELQLKLGTPETWYSLIFCGSVCGEHGSTGTENYLSAASVPHHGGEFTILLASLVILVFMAKRALPTGCTSLTRAQLRTTFEQGSVWDKQHKISLNHTLSRVAERIYDEVTSITLLADCKLCHHQSRIRDSKSSKNWAAMCWIRCFSFVNRTRLKAVRDSFELLLHQQA